MDTPTLITIIIALLSPAFAAGGAYWAVKVRLEYMQRDIDRNREEIRHLRSDHREDTTALHARVSGLNERMTKAGINGPVS